MCCTKLISWSCAVSSLFAVAGCVGNAANIKTSAPKVYFDDQVLKVLSERRADVRKLASTISAKEIQEILGAREAKSIAVSVLGGPKGSGSGEQPKADLVT